MFDDMINIKYLDPNTTKIKNLDKNICISYIAYVIVTGIRYVTVTSVKALYFIIDKINGYIEESKWKTVFQASFY